jgi:erythrin-vacuolar iron transport family protein
VAVFLGDFSKLTLKDALDLAVLIEEEAKGRYIEMAEQMRLHHTPEAAFFFNFMAENEEKHRAELAIRRVQLFGDAPPRVTPAMLFDVEAPEYDEVRAFMSAREALRVAFGAEKKAYAFFAEALPRILHPSVKVLFAELRDEEVHHQNLVLAQLEKTPPESLLKAADVVDEPVAQ